MLPSSGSSSTAGARSLRCSTGRWALVGSGWVVWLTGMGPTGLELMGKGSQLFHGRSRGVLWSPVGSGLSRGFLPRCCGSSGVLPNQQPTIQT